MSGALKMRFGATITDLNDTLVRAPVFNEPVVYDKTLLALCKAMDDEGRPLPKFSDEFNIFQYAHRSVQLATFLCTVLDVLLAFNPKKTDIRFVFEHEWDIRYRGYNMQAHIEILRPVEETVTLDPNGNYHRNTVSARSAPRSIVVQEAPPPPPAPPPEPKKRRMVLRRGIV